MAQTNTQKSLWNGTKLIKIISMRKMECDNLCKNLISWKDARRRVDGISLRSLELFPKPASQLSLSRQDTPFVVLCVRFNPLKEIISPSQLV